MRTIKFYTLGCKVNQYETQSIREQFINIGFKELNNSHPADFYLINTCTVTHRADTDCLKFIRRARQENPKAKIIVTGCLTELDADRIQETKVVNLIVKNRDKNKIVSLLNEQNEPNGLNEQNEPNGLNEQNELAITRFKNHTRAFLKIQDGCNNSCSYCKVPLVRGSSRSKDLSFIREEAKNLVKNGFKEIVLCGVCLGSYGRDLKPRLNLAEVIEALEKIEGLYRIRLSSIEARDVSDKLISKIKESHKLCHHLHIPFQSGDDFILKRMNRHYTKEYYLNLVKKIKKNIPEIAITTDIIVGFPQEKEENFKNTIKLLKVVLPLRVHIFPFSIRYGTPACKCKDKIATAVIKERINRLKDITKEFSLKYRKQFLGKTMAVLFEARDKKDRWFWQGHTANYLIVLLKTQRNLNNQIINARLRKLQGDSIIADFS